MGVEAIHCPMPPSVNAIWRSGRSKSGKKQFYSSDRYKTWKRVFDNIIMAMVPRPRIEGRFYVSIVLNEKRRRGDADNRVKAVLDALQRCGIIEDDKLADSVSVRWGHAPEGCSIFLYPLPDVTRPKEAA